MAPFQRISQFQHSRLCLLDLLLEENGAKAGIEGTDTLLARDLAETAHKPSCECGLRDKTDSRRLKRAQRDISEELCGSGGSKVDSCSIVRGGLVAQIVDELLLEQLITSEFEGTLQEVTSCGRTETGPDSASTLLCDELPEASD